MTHQCECILLFNIVASSDIENLLPSGAATKKRSRPLSEYSDSHYRRLKKQALAEYSSLRDIGHIPLSVRTYNTVTNQRDELQLQVENIEREEDDLVSIALMTKDRQMISGMYVLNIMFSCMCME